MWRIRNFFKSLYNFWYFRKEIWNYKEWDYTFQLRLWRRSLIPLREDIRTGLEESKSRMKKFAAIDEAIRIIDRILEDPYIEEAETQLAIDFLNNTDAKEVRKVVELSHKLAEQDWKRLWRIFEGQNHAEYIMLMDRQKVRSQVEKAHDDVWDQWFDGTDMRGWWN